MAKKKKTKKPATKKPSGLTFTRTDTINSTQEFFSISLGWTMGDKDYNGGQKMQYAFTKKKVKVKKKNKWVWDYKNISVGKTDTSKILPFHSKTETYLFSELYPNRSSASGDYLPKIATPINVHIRGRKKGWKKETKKDITTYTPKWSAWVEKEYTMLVPPDPVAGASTDSLPENSCSFYWSLPDNSRPEECFYDCYWETALVKDSGHKLGSDVEWSKLIPAENTEVDETHFVVASSSDPGFTTTRRVGNIAVGTKVKFTDTTAKHTCRQRTTPGERSGSVTITEDASLFTGNQYSYTRWFRVIARGPAGDCAHVAYAKHVYARASMAQNTSFNIGVDNTTGALTVDSRWDATASFQLPSDGANVEIAIDTPIVTKSVSNGTMKFSKLTPPANPSWSQLGSLIGSGASTSEFAAQVADNTCVFGRVNTTYNGKTTYGPIVLAGGSSIGNLSSPTLTSVDVNQSTKMVTVTATNNSSVENSYLAVHYRDDANQNDGKILAIIPWNSNSVTFKVPDWGDKAISFGVEALVADYSPASTTSNKVTEYSITNRKMSSAEIVWDGGSVPLPPVLHDLTSPSTGTIEVKWDWRWDEANSAELSWSDREDAWESTNPPSTYMITNMHPSQWRITGLGTGKWYVKVRLCKQTPDSEVFGTYSERKEITLASAPDIPMIRLSDKVIKSDGQVSVYWSYSSDDNSPQKCAVIAVATVKSDGTVTYKDIIQARTDTTIKLNAADYGWTSGTDVNLCVKVVSKADQWSNGYSNYETLHIADPPTSTVTVTGDCMRNKARVIDSDEGTTVTEMSLVKMPITFNVAGAGSNSAVWARVERVENYTSDRPDESEVDLYSGELMAEVAGIGDGNYTISQSDSTFYTTLDDGELFALTATVRDAYGQTADSKPIIFRVNWDHQAKMPTAVVRPDPENLITVIRPVPLTYDVVDNSTDTYENANPKNAGWKEYNYATSKFVTSADTGVDLEKTYYTAHSDSWAPANGDVCDIYRLSADAPELIVANAQFGVDYVDPYPTLGEFGGHRIVFKTVNGDYKTDKGYAWTDYDADDDNIHETFATIIDFGNERAYLPYNVSVSNQWKKDFIETKYLGGSVVGDWNPAVSRSGTVNTTVVVEEDPDTLRTMRRLAAYSGICHVRTPEGSSYAANVDVTEDREEKFVRRLAKFSLSITRIDSEGEDGMTLEAWNSMNEE